MKEMSLAFKIDQLEKLGAPPEIAGVKILSKTGFPLAIGGLLRPPKRSWALYGR
jgi:hypothetical protein